jgi:asparagine synthase (glutamine-hydrolysing)
MCGIAGSFSPRRSTKAEAIVRSITASQHRRGPDHQAIECIRGGQTQVVMGHNRLSIIDLTSLANQPMWDGDHRYCLVYNGEIYNYLELRAELSALGHRFFSRSDSEVIIEAFKEWGLDALDRFNGMFAFALYDSEKETMWLVRDRFGVKPLYYYSDEDTVLFASTGRVIAEFEGLEPDLDYAARGLVYSIYDDDTELSQYRGLKALRPGHCLQLRPMPSGRPAVRLHSYYDLESRVRRLREAVVDQSPSELTQMVTERLRDAVAIRLRSDVSMGISLSGGLDSAALAGLLARRHHDITGFTFGHPEEPASEGPLVQEMSERTKIGVHFVWPQPAEFIDAFWEALDAQDAPFPGPSIVAQYLVFKAASAHGVKVLLGGQGGDELFMGYRKFQLFHFLELAGKKRYLDAIETAVGILSVLLAEYYKILDYLGHLERYRGGRRRKGALRFPDPSPLTIGYDPAQPLWERQLQDVTRYSLPTLLRYEDRNSMGNSVESRLPFLDYRLVELALALPTALKIRRGYGKWIVRQATTGMVLDRIRLARYKRPFDVRLRSWIEQGLGESIRVRLRGTAAKTRDFLSPGTDISQAWSDAQLVERSPALAEAVTLIWLGERMQ